MNVFALTLSGLLAASAISVDIGFELLVTSSAGPTPRTCHSTPGLPNWVRGAYLVSGPAKFELGEYKMNAIFDGFGMINRFEMRDGEVCFTSAWIDSMYRNKSQAKGCVDGFLFEDTTPSRPLECYGGGAQVGGDNNWVNAIALGSEVMLLSDTALMMRLDLETLEQPGRKSWVDDRPGTSGNPSWTPRAEFTLAGSAHPVRRPGTSMWVGILSEGGLVSSQIDLYTFNDKAGSPQPRRKFGTSGPLKHMAYVHSYGVTPNYTILPVTMGMGVHGGKRSSSESCIGATALLCAIHGVWQGIHVVDFEGNVTIFDVSERFTHVHVVNSYENATGVTLDVGAYGPGGAPFSRSGALDITMFRNKTQRDANPSRAAVRRVHLHISGPLAGRATSEEFNATPGSHTDFYRINNRYSGLPYCVYYAVEWWHDTKSYSSMAVLKHNLCSGIQSYWSKPGVYVGEPYFVENPSSRTEDDGLLVFVALDGPQNRSMLVVLDAMTMQERAGPVKLARHIPFTAHGNFFPDA